MEFKEDIDMKVYVVMWEHRVGADTTREWIDDQAFTSIESAKKYIEGRGLGSSNSRYDDKYIDYGRGLCAWAEELTLIDAIETKDGIAFIESRE